MGARGGAAAGRYINPSFPWSGERCIVSTFHTTGVYGTTLRGEPLIPLYILSTGSLREEDYRIDSRVCEGLPTVIAAYGADEEACYSSAIGEIARGMTWDEHMAAAALDIREQWKAEGEVLGENFMLDAPPLFALGGI